MTLVGSLDGADEAGCSKVADMEDTLGEDTLSGSGQDRWLKNLKPRALVDYATLSPLVQFLNRIGHLAAARIPARGSLWAEKSL